MNSTMRSMMGTYKGYEVSFKDHSFTIAFAKISEAVNWCMAVQQNLLYSSWPDAILNASRYRPSPSLLFPPLFFLYTFFLSGYLQSKDDYEKIPFLFSLLLSPSPPLSSILVQIKIGE